MERAAVYVRTDLEGKLPTSEEQRATLEAYAREKGYKVVAFYEDLGTLGLLLYHRPGLKKAINNIKEEEDWEVLSSPILAASPTAIQPCTNSSINSVSTETGWSVRHGAGKRFFQR
jgi:hypothetical protein